MVARRQGSEGELSIAFLRWWYRAGQGMGGAGLQVRQGTAALHQCLTRPSIGLDASSQAPARTPQCPSCDLAAPQRH